MNKAITLFFIIITCNLQAQLIFNITDTLAGNGTDISTSIIKSNNGGIILTAFSNSESFGGVNPMGTDIFFFEYDNNLDLTNIKTIGGSGSELGRLERSSNGGYILVGRTDSEDGDIEQHIGSIDIWVVKLDDNFEIEWQNTIGDTLDDYYIDILETRMGEYVALGMINTCLLYTSPSPRD